MMETAGRRGKKNKQLNPKRISVRRRCVVWIFIKNSLYAEISFDGEISRTKSPILQTTRDADRDVNYESSNGE